MKQLIFKKHQFRVIQTGGFGDGTKEVSARYLHFEVRFHLLNKQ